MKGVFHPNTACASRASKTEKRGNVCGVWSTGFIRVWSAQRIEGVKHDPAFACRHLVPFLFALLFLYTCGRQRLFQPCSIVGPSLTPSPLLPLRAFSHLLRVPSPPLLRSLRYNPREQYGWPYVATAAASTRTIGGMHTRPPGRSRPPRRHRCCCCCSLARVDWVCRRLGHAVLSCRLGHGSGRYTHMGHRSGGRHHHPSAKRLSAHHRPPAPSTVAHSTLIALLLSHTHHHHHHHPSLPMSRRRSPRTTPPPLPPPTKPPHNPRSSATDERKLLVAYCRNCCLSTSSKSRW